MPNPNGPSFLESPFRTSPRNGRPISSSMISLLALSLKSFHPLLIKLDGSPTALNKFSSFDPSGSEGEEEERDPYPFQGSLGVYDDVREQKRYGDQAGNRCGNRGCDLRSLSCLASATIFSTNSLNFLIRSSRA